MSKRRESSGSVAVIMDSTEYGMIGVDCTWVLPKNYAHSFLLLRSRRIRLSASIWRSCSIIGGGSCSQSIVSCLPA